MTTAPRHRRANWQREIGESKIDMGLLEPMSQQALDMSLYMAVVDDDHQAVRAMKDSGVNPDMIADGKLGEPTGTLLHYAARHASLKTVIALLNLGANPLALDGDGKTPREAAAERTIAKVGSVISLWEKKKYSPAPQKDNDDIISTRDAAMAS